MSDRFYTWFRVAAVTIFVVVAGYTFGEWWYWQKAGLGELRQASAAPGGSSVGSSIVVTGKPTEPSVQAVDVEAAQQAVLAKVAAQEEKAGRLVLEIERLQRQVRVLREQLDARDRQLIVLQRAMESLKGQVVPVVSDAQLVSLAKEFGFTKIQVRP